MGHQKHGLDLSRLFYWSEIEDMQRDIGKAIDEKKFNTVAKYIVQNKNSVSDVSATTKNKILIELLNRKLDLSLSEEEFKQSSIYLDSSGEIVIRFPADSRETIDMHIDETFQIRRSVIKTTQE